MPYVINIDGGTRGNPGPSAWGVVIQPPGQPKINLCGVMDNATNNEAEYEALIQALTWLNEHAITESTTIYGDSKLVVNQVGGTWNVNQESLIPIWAVAYGLYNDRKDLYGVQLIHIPREENSEADALCNKIMDEHGFVFKRNERKSK
jgi:ribonuclease HI